MIREKRWFYIRPQESDEAYELTLNLATNTTVKKFVAMIYGKEE